VLLHIDSFSSYSTGADLAQTYSQSNMQFSTTAGRFGGGALYFNTGYNQYISYMFSSAQTEIWVGFAIQSISFQFATSLVAFNSISGPECTITLATNTGIFYVYKGYNNLLGQSSSQINFSNGIWHYIDIHYKISSSVGIVEIWVDGTQNLNLTGVDTTQYSNTSFSSLAIGVNYGYQYSGYMYVCELYILNTSGSYNNTKLGDSRIHVLLPNSDAGPNNGTPSTGNVHYTMVNEPLWSSSNSITLANTIGQEELFGVTSLPTSPPNVYGVQLLAIAEKTDAGNVQVETVLVNNGNICNGSNVQLLTSYSHIYGIYETDPNTGNAWTSSGVNTLKAGFEIT
jgi:hypothetical protein